MNNLDLTPTERDDFRDMLEAGAHRITHRRRVRAQAIAGAFAVVLVAAVSAGVITGSAVLRNPTPITATSTELPSPSVTYSPGPATESPTPTPTPTATPTSTPPEPRPTAQELIDACIMVTRDSFVGTPGETLTYHIDQAITGLRPDGTHAVYVPATDTSPQLVGSESAAACILTDEFEVHGAVGTLPWTTEEIQELLDGTGPAALRGGE
ncbi:hypothetical protein [Microbacterium flavescens]|uniref:hypothetical protein n=1 Tax=Microbacterium flavescens TaxID=69366 RepID=UPI001BDE1CB4|nr:hypothetical protein [Microbacterium flavescens]BFF09217.1 hypothetical protein GCM10025699_05200 [Microbacterium flavescens]